VKCLHSSNEVLCGKKELPFEYFSSFVLRGSDQPIHQYKNTATSKGRDPQSLRIVNRQNSLAWPKLCVGSRQILLTAFIPGQKWVRNFLCNWGYEWFC